VPKKVKEERLRFSHCRPSTAVDTMGGLSLGSGRQVLKRGRTVEKVFRPKKGRGVATQKEQIKRVTRRNAWKKRKNGKRARSTEKELNQQQLRKGKNLSWLPQAPKHVRVEKGERQGVAIHLVKEVQGRGRGIGRGRKKNSNLVKKKNGIQTQNQK